MTPLKSAHPEAHHGEVFLTNASLSGFESITWATKRRGIVAYDCNDVPVMLYDKHDFRPVFVSAAELAGAHIHRGIVYRRKLIGDVE